MNNKRRTKIVTHTGGDLPLAKARELGIDVIPDIVIFGETEYRNMTELSAEAFYEMMRSAPKLPTSSHPTTGDFVKAFSQAGDEEEILCLTVTSKMSGTYDTAVAAQKYMQRRKPECRITVYDTLQCSHGMGRLITAAAEYAEEGLSAAQIVERLEALRPKLGVYFLLSTLENARKGGRVGALKAMAADAMNLKPLLSFADGLVQEHDLAFGRKLGTEKLVLQFEQEADLSCPVTVFHAMVPDQAQAVAERLKALGASVEIYPVGPVIGIYTGEGCVGVAYTRK